MRGRAGWCTGQAPLGPEVHGTPLPSLSKDDRDSGCAAEGLRRGCLPSLVRRLFTHNLKRLGVCISQGSPEEQNQREGWTHRQTIGKGSIVGITERGSYWSTGKANGATQPQSKGPRIGAGGTMCQSGPRSPRAGRAHVQGQRRQVSQLKRRDPKATLLHVFVPLGSSTG